jgi:hypothetical protein
MRQSEPPLPKLGDADLALPAGQSAVAVVAQAIPAVKRTVAVPKRMA